MVVIINRNFLKKLAEENNIELTPEFTNSIMTEFNNFKSQSDTKLQILEHEIQKVEMMKPEKSNMDNLQYEELKKEFEAYKKNVALDKTNAIKKEALQKMLEEQKINSKVIPLAIKNADLNFEIDENGKITNPDIVKKYTEELKDFIAIDEIESASVHQDNVSTIPEESDPFLEGLKSGL